jgi:hypothetical protein
MLVPLDASCHCFLPAHCIATCCHRDAPRRLPYGQALNTHFTWGPAPVRPATQVAEDLRQQILALYDAHLSPDGRRVSYSGMQQDPRFWRYVDATAELQWVCFRGGGGC